MRKSPARTVATSSQLQLPPSLSPSKLAVAIATALSGAAAFHALPVRAEAASSDTTLEEVIVTARKRTENLQDVPISIDVFTSKDLQNLGISQFEDYAAQTPSISFVPARGFSPTAAASGRGRIRLSNRSSDASPASHSPLNRPP